MYCTSPIPLRTATGYDFEHFYCSSYVFNCFLTTVYKYNCPTIENHKISPKTTPEHLYCSKDPFFKVYCSLLSPPTTVYICDHNKYYSGTHSVCHYRFFIFYTLYFRLQHISYYLRHANWWRDIETIVKNKSIVLAQLSYVTTCRISLLYILQFQVIKTWPQEY